MVVVSTRDIFGNRSSQHNSRRSTASKPVDAADGKPSGKTPDKTPPCDAGESSSPLSPSSSSEESFPSPTPPSTPSTYQLYVSPSELSRLTALLRQGKRGRSLTPTHRLALLQRLGFVVCPVSSDLEPRSDVLGHTVRFLKSPSPLVPRVRRSPSLPLPQEAPRSQCAPVRLPLRVLAAADRSRRSSKLFDAYLNGGIGGADAATSDTTPRVPPPLPLFPRATPAAPKQLPFSTSSTPSKGLTSSAPPPLSKVERIQRELDESTVRFEEATVRLEEAKKAKAAAQAKSPQLTAPLKQSKKSAIAKRLAEKDKKISQLRQQISELSSTFTAPGETLSHLAQALSDKSAAQDQRFTQLHKKLSQLAAFVLAKK